MRLINAEKLEYSFELSIKSWGRDCNSNAPTIANTYKRALKRVKEEPTIDAVEVVRCKDCKHYVDENNGFAWCVCHTAFDKHYVKPNDFCSYGERKAND